MKRTTAAAAVTAGAALGHLLPSTLVLHQWSSLRALPGDLCRWRGPDVAKVALTFDDGPSPGDTERILDRLDSLGLVATFFFLGRLVRSHPDLAREVRARGHAIGTHGDSHESHLLRSPRWVGADLRRALAAHAEAGLDAPRWFRPPYGHVSLATLVHARSHHLRPVLWSAMGREWQAASAEEVSERVISSVDRGGIVLLHDSDVNNPPGSTTRVVSALGRVAEHFATRGWEAVTLDDLVST